MSPPTSGSVLRYAPVYLFMLLSATTDLSTLGAPIIEEPDTPIISYNRPNVSAQAAIAGVILIPIGLFLCFASTLRARNAEFVLFLSGFIFDGGLIYIIMVNSGVSSSTWLLVGPLLAGIAISFVRIALDDEEDDTGVGFLGPTAMHCFSLWLLGAMPSGLITSKTAQIVVMVVMDVMGLAFVFIPSEYLAASVSCSMTGAFAIITGVDFFARTGYIELADSFINSKSIFDGQDRSHGIHYTFMILIVFLAVAGIAIQRIYGDKEFTFGNDSSGLVRSFIVVVILCLWICFLPPYLMYLIVHNWGNICDGFCMRCCFCVPTVVRKCCCCGGGRKHSLDYGYDSD
ncbi:MAG: hypothetical protein J3Q66DRAFT_352820 [Benniella sp.]|nr:MAG: hypothetical protein J3Q66DRAFT_352820 [Benniella sp.]